jgi:hypothetical protein
MSLGKKSSQSKDDEPIRTISDSSTDRAIGFGLGDTNASTSDAVKPDEDMTKWLKEAAWKQPKWLKRTASDKPKNLGFRGYYLNSLRARYLRLESDFRTGYNNFYHTPYMDLVTARRIISFLQTSKEALEDDDCDVTDVITMLDMVDQNMVWIYPPHYAYAQAYGIAADLKGQTNEGHRAWGSYLENEIARLGPDNLGGIRAALDKTKEAINEAKQAAIISNGLQIERLKTARNWSWIVLGVSLVFLPMVINFDSTLWEKTILGKFLPEMRPWLIAIAIAIFGAGGAFFSSLRSVQSTRTVLSDFQENLKSNQLKLNIGALAALILFVFMSWQIIPGIDVKNAGTFIFLAFVAGFSEKFFLNLLNIDEQSDIAPRPAPAELKQTAQILPQANMIAPPTEGSDEIIEEVVNDKVEVSNERM